MDSYKTYSDEQLVELLKQSNDAAFTEIFNRYWDKLLAVAFHRTGNTADAKEIVQCVFVALWNRRSSLEIRYTLSTYLSTAVKYETINFLSAIARRENAIHAIPFPSETPQVDELDFKELQKLVHELVNALPEKCRIIYQLSRNEGMKNKEIAKTLNISEKTVENQLTIALRKLKSDLGGPAAIIFCSFWG